MNFAKLAGSISSRRKCLMSSLKVGLDILHHPVVWNRYNCNNGFIYRHYLCQVIADHLGKHSDTGFKDFIP